MKTILENFEYRVDPDDFVFYELGRLIEEESADLEDDDFRRLIGEGIREHVELRPDIRRELAALIRATNDKTYSKVVRLIEDPEAPLSGEETIVRSYTRYLFRKLEQGVEPLSPLETEACNLIERWQRAEILREELTKKLKLIGRPAVAPLADLLFDSLDDRTAAEAAVDVIGAIPSPVSARVLAHAISEPMLDEDLELKAYWHVRSMWPLPRFFVLYSLRPHAHEDLPFRWFQLLVEMEEPSAVDRIIEELIAHAENPNLREDLLALLELLRQSRDPSKEDKILHVLNSPEAPRQAAEMLEEFLRNN